MYFMISNPKCRVFLIRIIKTLNIRNFGKINDLVICKFVNQNQSSSVRKDPNTCTRLLSHQVVNQDSDLEVQALNQPIVLQDLELSHDGIQCSICPSSSLIFPVPLTCVSYHYNQLGLKHICNVSPSPQRPRLGTSSSTPTPSKSIFSVQKVFSNLFVP